MERFVDIDRFFGLLALCACEALLFRAGQIDELQFGHSHVVGVPQVLRLNGQTEDGVGARGEIVQIVTRKDTVTGTIFVEVQDFLWTCRFKNI